MPEVSLHLSDNEMRKVQAYAQLHQITDDEAASALASGGLADRSKKAFRRPPAQVYQMPKRSKC